MWYNGEAPQGLPEVPGWAREGISLLLLRPALPVPRPVFVTQPLPEVSAFQGLWAAVLVHKVGEPAPGRSQEDGCRGWVLLSENPGNICTPSRSRPLFSRVTDWLI